MSNLSKIPDHLSYSALHHLACPYASWLKYEHQMRGPTTPWLALGSAVHTSLERTHLAGSFDLMVAVNLFKNEFNRIIEEDEVFVGYPQMVKLRNEGAEMVERYYDQIKSGKIKDNPLVVEKEFSIPVAGTKVVGKIDKLEIDDDGEYTVTDFKTGRAKPNPWDLRHNLQLTTYYWAVFVLYGKYPKKVVWHHMRTGDLLDSEREPQDIKNLQDMIQNAVWMKQKGIRHRIFHEGVCNFCDFRGETCTDYELEAKLLND